MVFYILFRLLANLTSSDEQDTCNVSSKDIFSAFKSIQPKSALTCYKLNILVQNVFPGSCKTAHRALNISQIIFKGIVWNKENVAPLDDVSECRRLAAKCGLFFDNSTHGQLKFVDFSAHRVNDQRALKEIVIHTKLEGVVTLSVGGQIVKRCSEILPSCTTFAEVKYNVNILKRLDI